MKTPWDFVEKYYPNYYSCVVITECEDYQKIVDGQIDGYAEELYNNAILEKLYYYGGTVDEADVEAEVVRDFYSLLQETTNYICLRAIGGYLETLK